MNGAFAEGFCLYHMHTFWQSFAPHSEKGCQKVCVRHTPSANTSLICALCC